jgi:23S rRNA (adenine2503-C2)-methyltransferase
MIPQKKRLLGMTPTELKALVVGLGMPAFTAKQVAQWLYVKHVKSIDEMTNLSKQNRELLSEHFEVGTMAPIDYQRSKDGTIKYLFPVQTADSPRNATLSQREQPTANSHLFVETVFIPDHDRATLCVSCQVGCKMNCLFCQTGKQGWQGNLTAADILNQIYALPEVDQLTNIVFMGQGEPMDNLDAVLRVTEIMTADWGWQWSPKRITVSSVGVKGKLKRFLDESPCHVAISMHSPLHEQRLQLMPAEKAMPLEETIALLKQYDFTHQRRCSFEYICFGGLNDSPLYGREIVRLLEGLECRVNLIRFHEIPGVNLPASDEKRMEALRDYLTAHGITTTIRASRGQDIFAACGLLSTARQNELKEQPSNKAITFK